MRWLFLCVFVLFFSRINANEALSDSIDNNKRNKLTYAGVGTGVLYGASMFTLYKAWYAPYSSSKFHFFNDLGEWNGMDKIGHITTSYFVAQWIQSVQENIGLDNKNAPFRSIVVPLAFMTTIEVFDGFSSGWGFSLSDFAANSIGLSSFYFQNKFWNDQRLLMKYSYRESGYSAIRPALLGANELERMLKDYNSQTYWISYPIKYLWPKKANRIPDYLSISLGYGINGFLGARSNVWQSKGGLENLSAIKRQGEWNLSLDIDLKKLPIKGRAWQLFTSTIRWIKVPAPTISFRKDRGFGFYPIAW